MKTRIKYRGWTVKRLGENTTLFIGFFNLTRREVIDQFEGIWGRGSWAKKRRKGEFKLVKIRVTETMVEVEDER